MRTQERLDGAFAALADPTRRAVVSLLLKNPRRSSDMAEALSTTRPAMSRHLRLLRKADLVEECPYDADARVRMYRLRRVPFAEIRAWLDEVEALWRDQLDAFAAHVEKKHGKPRR
jgi:DNA-binding transcriptional ArsR family regulator